ncbi:MAG: DNA adenine methylase [Candidatus Methylumidiphilus sp.]
MNIHNPRNKGFLSWIGGKSRLASTIIPLIPPHTCYCEVFAGGAWVLFKKEPSKSEAINDINRDLVTLYRCVKHHMVEVVRYFQFLLVSRDEFERFLKEEPDSLTDIQRAVRFFYLVKTCYGARIHKPVYGISRTGRPRLNLATLGEDLTAAYVRLQHVNIERLPYAEFISRYDGEETFFYIDPPYFNCENYYGEGIFSREDFGKLADQLAGIKGKFILSINDAPEIRKTFRQFNVRLVKTKYSVGGGNKQKPVGELLFANFPFPTAQ